MAVKTTILLREIAFSKLFSCGWAIEILIQSNFIRKNRKILTFILYVWYYHFNQIRMINCNGNHCLAAGSLYINRGSSYRKETSGQKIMYAH